MDSENFMKENLINLAKYSHDLYRDYNDMVMLPDKESELFLKNIKTKGEYLLFSDSISKMDKLPCANATSNALVAANSENVGFINRNNILNTKNIDEYNSISSKKISREKVNKVVNNIVGKHENIDNDVKEKIKSLAENSLIKASQSGGFNPITGESKTPFSQGLLPMKTCDLPKPKWHPPWKLMRVISGHTGWVRCVAVDPSNSWFATGSADRMIKIWDLARGTLKLSLTGHISTVRGVAVSDRHPYLFSCGEDKTVKCWDLEQNKVVRHYHGHLSGVYCLSIHPTLDILVSGGRDSVARVWDMRTKSNIHTLSGHSNTVASLLTQAPNPQVITGSHDSTIRFWDLVAGKSLATLTNHKKSVRAMALHPTLFCMASGAPDNIKQWKLPNGDFMQNLSGHNAVINALCINMDNVVVSGGDNGSMNFWDWKSGYCFQQFTSKVQPGSLDSEAGIFAMTFDHSSSRLITCEADKTIKIYKEDELATEETHPIDWKPNVLLRKRF